MASKLDIDSLQMLKAISVMGGITRAAESLALTQPAVSHKIRRLEEKLNRPLLNRQSGMSLFTDDGERLLNYAERILDLHDEALTTMGLGTLKGRLKIGTTEDITSSSIARILAQFTRSYPSVEVNTQVGQSLSLIRRIKSNQLDLAVMQVFESDKGANDTVISVDTLHWVSALESKSHKYDSIPFIAFDKNCIYRNWVMETAKQNGLKIRTVLECPSIEGVCSAVEAGLGVSIINKRNFRPGMAELDIDLPSPPNIAYVIRSSDRANPGLIQPLTDTILSESRSSFI